MRSEGLRGGGGGSWGSKQYVQPLLSFAFHTKHVFCLRTISSVSLAFSVRCVSGSVRDGLRNCGGLSFLLEMVYSRPHTAVLQTALLTLGCASERNGQYSALCLLSVSPSF